MKLYVFFLFASILFAGCKHDTKVVFPDNISEEVHNYIQTNKFTVITYIDSIECTPCSLSPLSNWKTHKKELDKYNTNLLLVIHSDKEQETLEILQSLGLDINCVFDREKKFYDANEKLFKIADYETFVIDEHNNVRFTGLPIVDEKHWKAFIEIID
jgi:hypothetical protein